MAWNRKSPKASSSGSLLKSLAKQHLNKRQKKQKASYTEPVAFAHDVLGMKTWERQEELLAACAEHKRVSVRSGHKVSKSTSAAVVAWWFFSSFDLARVIITAPTAGQIRRILWRELRIRARHSKISLPHVPKTPDTGITSEDGLREIVGISTDEAERMQGFSSPNMLYIIDEGSGVSEEIFEAIEGNLAGGARVLMLGNPTQPVGKFYDSFNNEEESQFWHNIHISSWEAARSKRHIPGLATLDWCDEKLRSWGKDDPRYKVRVEGEFADLAEMQIIGLHLVHMAERKWQDTIGEGRLQLGVDPARFGDDESVIAIARGKKVFELRKFTKMDEHALAEEVERAAKHHLRKGEQKAIAKVDSAGVGAGVVSVLRARGNVDVIGVNGGDPAYTSEEYINLRAQLWFDLADWLKDGGVIPTDSRLEGDLLAPKYDFCERTGRRKVESKKEMKKRLKRSPDRADAVALAVFRPRIQLVHHIPKTHALVARGSYRQGGHRGY